MKHVNWFIFLYYCFSILNPRQLKCTTMGVPAPTTTTNVTVFFDGAVRSFNQRFTFTPNPNISNIQPIRAFKSGGREITVTGRNFLSIQKPLMYYVQDLKKSNVTVCILLCSYVNKCIHVIS